MHEISAGCIVYRICNENIELLFIEDRFSKLCFAKGHTEPGESLEETALRELREETGISGRILDFLGKVRYVYSDPVRGKVTKTVAYYLAEAAGGEILPQQEEIRGAFWQPLAEAIQVYQQRGYTTNQAVLKKAVQRLEHYS